VTVYLSDYVSSSGISSYADIAGISTYSSTAGIASYADIAGISTYSSTAGIASYTGTAGISTDVIGGIASVSSVISSGIVTSLGGFTTGLGVTNPVRIEVSGNILSFNVFGVGSTTFILSP
jgi:hypothetical protein